MWYNIGVDNVSIGQRIERARIRAGLTQEQLGKAVGLRQGSISAYEHGKVGAITLDILARIARATGTPIQEFLAEATTEPVTLAEVLRREYPDMDAGTVRTMERMAKFLYEQSLDEAGRKRRKGAVG